VVKLVATFARGPRRAPLAVGLMILSFARASACCACFVAVLGGCATHVRVESRPPGALVTARNGDAFSTPDKVYVGFWPFARRAVVVTAPGYRPADVRLKIGVHRVEVVMVPEHGPSGTWTPESEGLSD
jgi:hypothetical protein